jgi:CDP-glucose 4,6-dehydratase
LAIVHELTSFEKALAGKKIFVTGHTGFTGGWVCRWLGEIGSIVAGFSLPPITEPSLFNVLGLAEAVPTVFGDISDYDALYNAVRDFEPHLILHLAAQPLVRESYRDPVRTFQVNVQGTVHLLEAARHVKSVKAVLCITTDKVYHNNEWLWAYRENDRLGGKDPYSASKAAAEFAIQSFAASFAAKDGSGPAIATARGGNIVGGGDWSDDRLIPDFVRAIKNNAPLTLRFPEATRPWQHVLALVQGYLMLLAGLISDDPARFARAWNLGPLDNRTYSVRDVLEMMCEHWGRRPELHYMDNPLPESRALALDSANARDLLGWRPVWETDRVIQETARWYRGFYDDPSSAPGITLDQINSWRAVLK